MSIHLHNHNHNGHGLILMNDKEAQTARRNLRFAAAMKDLKNHAHFVTWRRNLNVLSSISEADFETHFPFEETWNGILSHQCQGRLSLGCFGGINIFSCGCFCPLLVNSNYSSHTYFWNPRLHKLNELFKVTFIVSIDVNAPNHIPNLRIVEILAKSSHNFFQLVCWYCACSFQTSNG